jgi:hypothetical protein
LNPEKELFLKSIYNPLMHYSQNYLKFLDFALPNTFIDSLSISNKDGVGGTLHYAYVKSSQFGTVINSLPFFGSHGGPLSSDSLGQKELLEKFGHKIEEINPISVTLIETPFQPLSDDFLNQIGLKYVDFRIGQFTPLPADMTNFHVKTRNAIRKGLKLKLNIEKNNNEEGWSWMQSLHEKSINQLGGVPKKMAIFDSLKKAFGDDVELWIGYLGKEPITGLVIVRFNETVEYFTPVVDETYKDSQALSALIYTLMQKFSKRGFKLWNWGGTWESQRGVYRFKSRWGAFDKPYRYFNQVRSDHVYEISRDTLNQEFPYYYLYKY